MKKKILSLLLALCLIVGLLPLAAMAEEATVPEKWIRTSINNAGTRFWYYDGVDASGANLPKYWVPGTAATYATTTAEGAVADGTADNWNLKFEWPADGNPTLTFKGATLKGAYNEYPLQLSGNVDLTVVIESDSSIDTTNRAAFYVTNSGLTTITGPGKLTLTSTDGFCLQFAAFPTNLLAAAGLIKDAHIEIKVQGESSNRCGIGFYGGDLTIDNSKVHITGVQKSLAIWGYGKYTKDATGAVTKVGSSWKAGENDTTKRNLIIQNGSEVTGTVSGRQAIGANGDIIIKDSTVEFSVSSAENNFPVFAKKPVLEGNYTAIASEKKDGSGAVAYEASKYADHRYFKITPKASSGGTTGGTTGTTPSNPQTGDTFNVVLVSALALAAMASLAAVTVIGKKKVI